MRWLDHPRGARSLLRIAGIGAALAATACSPSPAARATPSPPPVGEAPTPLPPPREDGRLPALAVPTEYVLAFEIDPRAPRFSGTAKIGVDVPAKTSHVVLHAHALDVKDARALLGGEARVAKVSSRMATGGKPPVPEELVLSFDPPLPAGHMTLSLAYDAPFDEELSGLYRVPDAAGAYYAFTQFEATDARRAFPCFDEPTYKVPFHVSVTVPKGMIAAANAPEKARTEGGSTTTFHFAPTQPLPTYLVALAVGDLDVRELTSRTQKPAIRLLTTKGKTDLGGLALETTSALLDSLEQWFGIPYPYEKLDIVAVPEFEAGAMENAGLITFREELLLLDPARASVRARRAQAMTVAHELAHQWFGDLVTAAWWNDLWLNEGFATWMEWRVVDRWKPALGARLDAVAAAHGVMDSDALTAARAVRQPVVSTSDAHEAFDGITYEKGAAVLSTIERWIGEEPFRRGVREYLTQNAGKSVQADRLLGALDRASGKDVTQMASTFLDHTGVPEVSVQLECDRGSRWHAEVTQDPWHPLGSQAATPVAQQPLPSAETEHTWTIPVCVLAQGEKKTTCADLAWGAPSLVAGRGCPAWIHPNAELSYYRFTVSESDATKLASARAQLDIGQRISVLSNAWASVRAGKLPARALLKLLPAFDDEPSRHVVDQVVTVLSGMSHILVEDAARPAFRKFVQARLAKRKKALGWSPKKDEAAGSGDEALMRRSVLWALGELAEDDATLREADEHASRWLADPASVDSDTAAVALDLASRHAGAARLEQLIAAAKHAKTREDRIVALKATMGFDDPELLGRALDHALTPEVKANEIHYVLLPALDRRRARGVVEAWVRAHWDALRKKLPGSLSTMLVEAAGVACSRTEIDERAAFYRPRAAPIEGAARPLAESLEGASQCSELRMHGATSLTRELLDEGRRR